MLWLWGGLGAFVYGAPTLALALWSVQTSDKGSQKLHRILALANFVIAEMTGCIFAAGLTETVRSITRRFISVEAIPVALTIGWACNYLWPRVLRRLGQKAENIVDQVGNGNDR